MFRIGIIGSDNSHADAFSKLLNIENPKTGEFNYPDCRITAIFGVDDARTKEVAENGKIPFIAKTPEEMVGKVDAVMIVFRHGDLHAKYAREFLKLGMPVWLDKPFTIKPEEAKELFALAKEHNAILTGGSTCKFAYDILMLKNAVENGSRIGQVKAGTLNFPASLDSEYGGIYFYGGHLIEMSCAVFGYDAKSVVAVRNGKNVLATINYENYQVALNFIDGCCEYTAVLIGEKGNIVRDVDISIVYRNGMDEFVKTLHTGKIPLAFEGLYAVVELLDAVRISYETGKEVFIKGLKK